MICIESMVDLHFHIGQGNPPVDGKIARRYPLSDLKNEPMRAIGIKAHHFIPELLLNETSGTKIIPSLVLNLSNGGLALKKINEQALIWQDTPWILYFPPWIVRPMLFLPELIMLIRSWD